MFLVIGCDNKTTTISTTAESTEATSRVEAVVTLVNENNQMNRVFDDVFIGDVITLPVDIDVDKVFVGWSDGEEFYYGEYLIEQSVTLTAVYEEFEDVFEYMMHPETFENSITGYTGNAKYLRIPEMIDGHVVSSISSYAFEMSDIIEIEIPKTVKRINTEAFIDSLDLEKISFYGNYYGEITKMIPSGEYDDLIEENSDVCEIIETNGSSWKFSDGCPIKEVLSISETVYVPGLGSFYSYEVILDIRFYEDVSFYHLFNIYAFSNLPSLTTVEFPEKFDLFDPQMFSNTPSLRNLVFVNNKEYETRNGIVYSTNQSNDNLTEEEAQDILVYYPPALDATTFDVPDSVYAINPLAFMDNSYLEVINLPASVTNIGSRAFSYVYNLREINVYEENEILYSVDGVLYSGDFLLVYPRAKTDKLYIMPENIALIAPAAFFGQEHLVDIAMNDGLERIGYDAFTETEKIKVLNIPSSVIFIDSLYSRSSSLEIVIINRSAVIDGSITIVRTPRAYDFPIFYVPDDSYDDYRTDRDWSIMYNNIFRHSELEE
jgi:hypothetical protein